MSIERFASDRTLRMDRRYHRLMRSDPPPLLPILRSRTQAGVLTVLLLNPELQLTQTELARRVGASLSSVVDEVRRLEQAGLVSTCTLGRARLVRQAAVPPPTERRSGSAVQSIPRSSLPADGPVGALGKTGSSMR
jgi:hypothetical protein